MSLISTFSNRQAREPHTVESVHDLGVFLRSLGCLHLAVKDRAPMISPVVDEKCQVLVYDLEMENGSLLRKTLAKLPFTWYLHETFSAASKPKAYFGRLYVPLAKTVDVGELKTLSKKVATKFRIPANANALSQTRWFVPSTSAALNMPALSVAVKTRLTVQEKVTYDLDPTPFQ